MASSLACETRSWVASVSAPVFVSESAADAVEGDVVTLAGPEGRHAATVQRRTVGERIDLVDGRGRRLRGVIASVGAGELEIAVNEVDHDVGPPITLVQALAKGGRDEQAIEAAVELGVTAVVPWAADRSIVQWKGPKAVKALASWQALCLAAAKQSRRAWVPTAEPLATTRELAARVSAATASGIRVLVLHEDATLALADVAWDEPRQPVWLVVGPEGGIADSELSALVEAGAHVVRLGPHVLRASSAGPAAIAALAALRGDWG